MNKFSLKSVMTHLRKENVDAGLIQMRQLVLNMESYIITFIQIMHFKNVKIFNYRFNMIWGEW